MEWRAVWAGALADAVTFGGSAEPASGAGHACRSGTCTVLAWARALVLVLVPWL